MKTARIKVGTVLNTEDYQRLKVQAARQGRKISDLLGQAIGQYLKETPEKSARRRNTLRLLDSRIRLSREQFEETRALDFYDQ